MDTNNPFPPGLIQVAGIHDMQEARFLLEMGVDLIGIPLRLTVNAEDISEAQAASVSKAFPHGCCLITYLHALHDICDLAEFLEVDYIQLHGDLDPAILPRLKELMPHLRVIKSLVIGKGPTEDLQKDIQRFSQHVDAFITDTYDPDTGAEGATGKTHDWAVSRKLVQLSPRPVIMAGGLRPDNVGEAIQSVCPAGVDVHTGVEDASGRKNPELVRTFIANAKIAFQRQLKSR